MYYNIIVRVCLEFSSSLNVITIQHNQLVYHTLSMCIRVCPNVSMCIRVYPGVSTCFHVYLGLSGNIYVYPGISNSTHVYPEVFGYIRIHKHYLNQRCCLGGGGGGVTLPVRIKTTNIQNML